MTAISTAFFRSVFFYRLARLATFPELFSFSLSFGYFLVVVSFVPRFIVQREAASNSGGKLFFHYGLRGSLSRWSHGPKEGFL